MNSEAIIAGPVLWWIAAAVLFGFGEIVVPGAFLIFLAIAAAITGLVALALPDLPIAAQLISFTLWSAVTVFIGKRWYHDYPVASSDPNLNDRAARLINEEVIVSSAIIDGEGRVRIGDGEWSASGPSVPAGSLVRIVGVEGSTLLVEPVTPGLVEQ